MIWSILYASCSAGLLAQEELAEIAKSFVTGQVEVAGRSYGYRLLEPMPQQRHRQQPLLVYLHGAGERGDDNVRQLYWLPRTMAQPKWREQFPCYLLAVQCPKQEQWVDVPWGEAQPRPAAATPTRALRAVQQAMAEVMANPGIDPARVYLAGMSMGGYGTWDLLHRDAHLFAGAVPVCGGGDPQTVRRVLGLPIAIWHGGADKVVPVVRSQLMASQYEQLGLAANYHELPSVGHDVWRQAFAEGEAIDWLFAQDQRQQRRGAWQEIAIIPEPDVVVRRSGSFSLRPGGRCIVPEELRGLASYFLDALPVETSRRPGLIDGVEPAPGDIVLQLHASLQAAYELDIQEMVRLTAKDLRGMRAGLAALFQALQTLPGGGAPAGTFAHTRELVNGHLGVSKPETPWTRGPLEELLRECWLSSVQTVCFEGGGASHATARAYREFVVHAKRLGIDVDGAWPVSVAGPVVAATSGDRLAKVFAGRSDAQQTFVLLTSARPDEMLLQARQLLAATATAAQRNQRPVPLSSFLARLAARWR